MARQKRGARISRELERGKINLVSARSAMNEEIGSYSRSSRQGGYARQRKGRTLKRRILIAVTVTLAAILVGVSSGLAWAYFHYGDLLRTDSQGNQLDTEALEGVLVDRTAPENPFWMLLVGTDWDEGGTGVYRSDVIILARIDPGKKEAALVSIPRDTMVELPGVGTQKINAAYTYGELDAQNGGSGTGPAYCAQAVSDLTGVNISYYAQVNFEGLIAVVDAMGGVVVDVPLDIIGDREAGPVDVYAGDQQLLNGQEALVFCRSRQYLIGDFQRQANQRTLLQAIAKQVLSEDPLTIANTVTKICEMTTTNLNIDEIVSIANSMRGMQEGDIRTYSIPSSLDMVDDISYVIADEYRAKELIAALDRGEYPDYSEETFQGEATSRYKPKETGSATDNLASAGAATSIETTQYSVSVRNGYGIAGSATAVSDMLALAGYQQLEIANANSMVYKETLIIYRDDTDKVAADDIHARLGYGRVIPSLGRYAFEGNILVVVGGDFAG